MLAGGGEGLLSGDTETRTAPLGVTGGARPSHCLAIEFGVGSLVRPHG